VNRVLNKFATVSFVLYLTWILGPSLP